MGTAEERTPLESFSTSLEVKGYIINMARCFSQSSGVQLISIYLNILVKGLPLLRPDLELNLDLG
jgi:hypothetical protein